MQSLMDKNMLVLCDTKDDKLDNVKRIEIKIGNVIFLIKENEVQWEEIPSYDDPEMVYCLMTDTYVDQFKALIPKKITNIIKEETLPGSKYLKLLDEADKIYNRLCDRLNITMEIKERETIIDAFYTLIHNVVCIFYRSAFYGKAKKHISLEVKKCQSDYNRIISTLQRYKKSMVSDPLIQSDIDSLIYVFNVLIKRYYDQAKKYGTYFKEYHKSHKRECITDRIYSEIKPVLV